MTKARTIRAAEHFYANHLVPGARWKYPEDPISALVVAAFDLYERAWGSEHDIRDWEWPALELGSRTTSNIFRGKQPWTVLLRRAVELTA